MNVKELFDQCPVNKTIYDRGERDSISGLHVVRSSTTRKCYYLFYRTLSGRQRRPKIGDYSELTLEQARSIAAKIKAQVLLGGDPQAEKNKQRRAGTVNELYSMVKETHYGTKRYQNSGWAGKVDHLYKRHIKPKFGSLPLADVECPEVFEWYQKLAKEHPVVANHCLAILKVMWKHGMLYGKTTTNPIAPISAVPVAERDNHLVKAEIPKLIDALQKRLDSDGKGVMFLLTILYTGTRPSIIERHDLNDIEVVNDPEVGEYGILKCDGKTTASSGAKETVIFCHDLFWMYGKYGNPFKTKAPQELWAEIRKEIGREDLWLRDLRRTFASVGLNSGVAKDVIGKVLNHKDSNTTDIYAKLDVRNRVKAVNEINQIMAGR